MLQRAHFSAHKNASCNNLSRFEFDQVEAKERYLVHILHSIYNLLVEFKRYSHFALVFSHYFSSLVNQVIFKHNPLTDQILKDDIGSDMVKIPLKNIL